jgi:hypothetical protein
MSDCRRQVISDSAWIDYGNAAIQGKPNASMLIADNRPVPSHAFVSMEAIRKPKLVNIFLTKGPLQVLLSIHSKHMIRSCNPQRPFSVLRHPEDRLVQ